jgi:Ca2+/Na+ antiporter
MSTLRVAVAAGAFLYGAIAIVQLVQHETVRVQALAVLLVLCVAAYVTWAHDEHRLKRYEMVLLWICVLTFSLYAGLRIGGLV